MDKLLDVARRLGVDVYGIGLDSGDLVCPRPRLDIAHECLGKLPTDTRFQLEWEGDDGWRYEWYEYGDGPDCCGFGTFEEAVIALAERFLKEGI